MTEQEMISQIEDLQKQLAILKTQARKEHMEKRLMFPRESEFYEEQVNKFNRRSIEMLSKIIKIEFFRNCPLPKMDDSMYSQYSKIFEQIICKIAELKGAQK